MWAYGRSNYTCYALRCSKTLNPASIAQEVIRITFNETQNWCSMNLLEKKKRENKRATKRWKTKKGGNGMNKIQVWCMRWLCVSVCERFFNRFYSERVPRIPQFTNDNEMFIQFKVLMFDKLAIYLCVLPSCAACHVSFLFEQAAVESIFNRFILVHTFSMRLSNYLWAKSRICLK